MLLQDYLRKTGTIETLYETYKIDATRHSNYNNLVLFKYNQIESPFSEAIVRECRGVILDEADDWRIVNRGMDKFFNEGEGHAAVIDWKSARVQEKLDGSLMQLYSYNGGWNIATSGSPDAGGNVNGIVDMLFRDLFWKTFSYKLPSVDYICFYFELTSQYNRIVVQHKEPRLTLLGARDLITQRELPLKEASEYFPDCPVVKEFPLTSFAEITATFEHMDPLSQEGYVVIDGQFNRVKCKSPAYVALHHMRDGLGSKRALIEVVRKGEIDEVLVSFPEYTDVLMEAKGRLDALVADLEVEYEKIKDIPIQKDFAMQAVTGRYSSALFSLRAKKTPDIRTFFRDIHIDTLVRLLGYKTAGE